MENSSSITGVVQIAVNTARKLNHEYITPEHLLYALLLQDKFMNTLHDCHADGEKIKREVTEWLNKQETVLSDFSIPMPSIQFTEVMKDAMRIGIKEQKQLLTVCEYTQAILTLQDSEAAYLLGTAIEGREEMFMESLQSHYPVETEEVDDFADVFHKDTEEWKTLVSNISKEARTHTPIIGREKELDRTIQILCRMEKNNPMHIGDPGVGKTAIVYGLAKLINTNCVPPRLRGRKIYGVNIGNLLAGAQYRGEFEKRIKLVLDGAMEENAILYLDEIHNIVGAGRSSEGGPDASNILKPYLESGKLSFIGATTHDEYNKRIAKDNAIVRRFQTVDILEPSIDETIKIIYGLQPTFQRFHKVIYKKEALEYAVKASAKYITDRKLPDKAIDLIDEAGAYMEVHPTENRSRIYVTRKNIETVLQKVCKIQAEALIEDNNKSIATLKENIQNSVYGQNKAIDEVTNAVMMAKAGLTDENKPMASLLFVGPTGVGKTEVARVLAKELGVELVRFDMSEYIEKHSVAKLIGSPAGYVGYEDGGLLTAAIKKSPNCVLLLDEIEKAHSDIYNILLQVMDYAKLTDNRGQKADFRNVILIMTSNAGAQYASQASIGFGGGVSRGEAMMKQVKKTFKPEFINRLSDIVVFNDMDENMAAMILEKKLKELYTMLTAKNIVAQTSEEAFNALLKLGFTKEYGAREMERVISKEIKPLFMKEILFGTLSKGGTTTICYNDNKFYLKSEKK